MDTLINYITERIRIDNIKPVFPVDGTLDEIVDFLKGRDFKEIKDLPSLPTYTGYVTVFNKYKDKCFGIKMDDTDAMTIYLANTSKCEISKSNILYIIHLYPMSNDMSVRKIWGGGNMYTFLDKNEFKDEMESYFK